MITHSIKTITLAGVLALGITTSLAADSFQVALVFQQGPLNGQTFLGQFSTDGGDGLKAPFDGSLFDFNVTVDGVTFETSDDVDFPDFPLAEIASNHVIYMDGLLDNVDGFGSLDLFYDKGSFNEVTFAPTSGDASLGVLRFSGASVPDGGATLALCGVGLAGLAWQRRRWVG
jgi:hypothetical protein